MSGEGRRDATPADRNLERLLKMRIHPLCFGEF
jgi:hypothetical protein